MFGCGYGGDGEFNNNTRLTVSSPIQIGSANDWKGVVGNSMTLAIRYGKLFAMGALIPIPPGFAVRSSPVQIGSETGWTVISASTDPYNPMFGGIRNGKLFMWGYNNYGQVGDGTRTIRSSPVQIGSDTDWTALSCGREGAFGIRGGKIFAWGNNSYGRCGVSSGSVAAYSSPVQIGANTDWSQVSACYYGVHAIRAGQLYGWGNNSFGEIGNGTNDVLDHTAPVQIGTFDDWTFVASSFMACFGIRKPGRLYAWGYNEVTGSLGLGNLTGAFSSPVQVGSGIDWSYVSTTDALNYTAAMGIRSGKLYSWGLNSSGVLGLGDMNNRSSPVQVGSETDWTSASMGVSHAIAIRRPG
jgi:alpha-tubulin suppressor-like RCC1 family protein